MSCWLCTYRISNCRVEDVIVKRIPIDDSVDKHGQHHTHIAERLGHARQDITHKDLALDMS